MGKLGSILLLLTVCGFVLNADATRAYVLVGIYVEYYDDGSYTVWGIYQCYSIADSKKRDAPTLPAFIEDAGDTLDVLGDLDKDIDGFVSACEWATYGNPRDFVNLLDRFNIEGDKISVNVGVPTKTKIDKFMIEPVSDDADIGKGRKNPADEE